MEVLREEKVSLQKKAEQTKKKQETKAEPIAQERAAEWQDERP